jgi:hypothetical protein
MLFPAGAGTLRLQRLTLRLAPKRAAPQAAAALLAPSISMQQFGRAGSLPSMHIQAGLSRSRRPSALAMQMGLMPGGGQFSDSVSQVQYRDLIVCSSQ